MTTRVKPKSVEQSLKSLSLSVESEKHSSRPSSKPASGTKQPIADSWDDGEDEDGSDDEDNIRAASMSSTSHSTAPPPTPASPRFASSITSDFPESLQYRDTTSSSPRGTAGYKIRPEKTTATASRMIAAGLGIKTPRRTEEQRQYDNAARETERRKREKEREDKRRGEQEKEKRRAEMWDG